MRIVGDVHGKFWRYRQAIEGCSESIQIGDMGIGFGEELAVFPGHKFIRGNHDNPAACREHPNYLGDFGGDSNLFWVGGAYSIDRALRIDGVSWWRDEELRGVDAHKAFTAYMNAKPLIMLSHDAPSSIATMIIESLMLDGVRRDPPSHTQQMLQAMYDGHQPELWIFGHYHVSREYRDAKTRFVCLAELGTMEIDA